MFKRSSKATDGFHSGQVDMHQRMEVPEGLTMQMKDWWGSDIDESQRQFINQLRFFVLGTLDKNGRPWVSLVAKETPGAVKAVSRNKLVLTAEPNEYDPLLTNLREGFPAPDTKQDGSVMFSGLGLDYARRARVKIHGVFRPANGGRGMDLSFAMGNCPKYINTRQLVYQPRTARLLEQLVNSPTAKLSFRARTLVAEADSMFLVTRHLGTSTADGMKNDSVSSLDLNHRGGASGFVRISKDGSTLFWPDNPGNNIYSSMGNILTDRVAGLCIPNYETGDLLQLTGNASVLFGQEAEDLIPASGVLVRFKISGFVFTEAGVSLQQVGLTGFSPYNPRVLKLKSELQQDEQDTSGSSYGAKRPVDSRVSIKSAKFLAHSDFASFTFAIQVPFRAVPGQYIILDFAGPDDKESVLRTWTMTSFDETRREITCSIKLAPNGRITPRLFRELERNGEGAWNEDSQMRLSISFVGIEGEFSCFDHDGALRTDLREKKLLFIAAGAGITPFVAMWAALRQSTERVSVRMLLSSRKDESEVQALFVGSPQEQKLAAFNVFISSQDESQGISISDVQRYQGRLGRADLERIPDLRSHSAFICGPTEFMKDVSQWLGELEVADIRMESFAF